MDMFLNMLKIKKLCEQMDKTIPCEGLALNSIPKDLFMKDRNPNDLPNLGKLVIKKF